MQLLTVQEAKARVPRRTGDLGRSITRGTYSADRAVVVAAKNYAAAVEYGTKKYTITVQPPGRMARKPSKDGVLRQGSLAWGGGRRLSGRQSKGGKPEFFARSVVHPKTPGKPYLVPGAKAAVDKSGIEFFVKEWNEAD
jgi:hypothetical protein